MAGSYINKELSLAVMLVIYAYTGFCIYKLKKEKKEIKPAIFAVLVYIGVILSAYIISKIMTPILIDRYLLVITGLLIFFISFLMAKVNNKYMNIFIMAIVLAFSIFNNVHVIKTNYSKSNSEMFNFIDDNLQEGDSFLIYSNEISGFTITIKHPECMQYFYDNLNWGAGGAYECFGPNLVRDNNLDNILNNVSGRIWIINISEENFEKLIQSKYDVDLIERKEFNIAYENSYFSFTIIEK